MTPTAQGPINAALAIIASDYDITAEIIGQEVDGQFVISSPDTLAEDLVLALEETFNDHPVAGYTTSVGMVELAVTVTIRPVARPITCRSHPDHMLHVRRRTDGVLLLSVDREGDQRVGIMLGADEIDALVAEIERMRGDR